MKDIAIANKARLKPIADIARKLGIASKHIELYGLYKAKISLDALKSKKHNKRARYIVVTGITPTHLGEGKTVTTIGLAMAFNKMGRKAVACIRQPSLGPLFGVKGGGLGGGRSQVLPAEDIGLHFTGDLHAVSAAHNLCAAFLDNHLYRGNSLNIDPEHIFWSRVVDLNDRALRSVRIGLGGKESGFERQTRFDITAASELMAIIALAQSIAELRKRLSQVVVALDRKGRPVTCEDLKVAGAMAVILKDAIRPNLAQTIENTPCFVHTGPFANITHGNSSIVADRMALSLSDYVITESGFGADCGAEKFFDIKCRQSSLVPDAAVLVTSIRALKAHSDRFKPSVGKKLDKDIYKENVYAVEVGSANLEKQIENVRIFGVPCVVAINKFDTDTEREINLVKKIALRKGAFDCVVSNIYKLGSSGGLALANSVKNACEGKNSFKFLYPLDISIKDKISRIAKSIYGAKDVAYEKAAEENIARFTKLGYGKLPVCMAKTHLSLSADPRLKGRPIDFTLSINDVRPSIGAGFLYAICGKIQTMPSLPSHPI